MKLKTIAATYGRKLNLGDYNSAHAEVTLWADIEEGDDPEAATNALRQMARHHVMEEMARVKPALAAKVENLFMGLPTEVQKELKMVEDIVMKDAQNDHLWKE